MKMRETQQNQDLACNLLAKFRFYTKPEIIQGSIRTFWYKRFGRPKRRKTQQSRKRLYVSETTTQIFKADLSQKINMSYLTHNIRYLTYVIIYICVINLTHNIRYHTNIHINIENTENTYLSFNKTSRANYIECL